MATQKNNVVTHGLSGKVGDLLLFRQVGGKTVVSKIPERTQSDSAKQVAHRQRFQQAVLYARAAVNRAETGEQYAASAKKQRGLSAFNVAVADFFAAPDIVEIDLSGYAGKVGESIEILVSDDFAVQRVEVQIINADGSLVEEGDAVLSGGTLWRYTAMQENENLAGDKIIITAMDFPGNVTAEERGL